MDTSGNIKIRQTWIDEEVERCAEFTDEKPDDAFLLLTASLIQDSSYEDIDPSDVVDGGRDKQIDYIHIEDDPEKGHAEVIIIQAKNSIGFSSNVAVQIKNGLDWIFERSKLDVTKIDNHRFQEKILELRALRSDYGAANLKIRVFHITKGDTSNLSDEYLEEAKSLDEKYSSLGFGDFEFSQAGAHELMELIDAGDRSKRQIDVEIPVIYDVNRPSAMKFEQGDTNSLVCTISGKSLAEAASTDPRDAIFDLNVRPFYGSKGKVNRDIWETCTGDEASRFWFLNNGVTMVCDSFDFVQDPDDPKIKIKNAQIVNGCQTTVTIREAHEKGELRDGVNVMLRVYSTDNPSLVDKITLTTNNQNKITDRDLRANDPVQRDIERIMNEKYGYFYERKNRGHRALKGSKRKLIVPSPKAAQAYLAVVRTKPSNARGYLAAVWSDFYSEIFDNASVADLLVAYKILAYCHDEAKRAKQDDKVTAAELETRVYGSYHVARAMGYGLLKDNWGHSKVQVVEETLDKFEDEKFMKGVYSKAVASVVEIRESDAKEYPIPALYFKNSQSQRKLNAKLRS